MKPSAFRKASNSTDSLFGIYNSSRCQVTCLLLKATVVISCLDSTQKPPWELGKTPNKFISLELYVTRGPRCCSICTEVNLKWQRQWFRTTGLECRAVTVNWRPVGLIRVNPWSRVTHQRPGPSWERSWISLPTPWQQAKKRLFIVHPFSGIRLVFILSTRDQPSNHPAPRLCIPWSRQQHMAGLRELTGAVGESLSLLIRCAWVYFC